MSDFKKFPKALCQTKVVSVSVIVFFTLLISLNRCNKVSSINDPVRPDTTKEDTTTHQSIYTIKDSAYWLPIPSVINSNPAARTYPFGQWGYALSYSAYRDGQSPDTKVYPTETQISEDLKIISKKWKLIRLYDVSTNTMNVLSVISKSSDLDIKAMKVIIGAWIAAEVSNENNTWGKGIYTQAQCSTNIAANCNEVKNAIKIANQYPDIVAAVVVGNEALVDWTDHMTTEESMIRHVVYVRKNIKQPVTVADNYVPWTTGLTDLGNVVDFITIHTYPLWEAKQITETLDYTKSNYNGVKSKHPSKRVVIGECGWATASNGTQTAGQVPAAFANETNQRQYFKDLNNWSKTENITAFFFEAFDENWKGSSNSKEPEKHWGLFTSNRKAKLAMQDNDWYPEIAKSDTSKIDTSTSITQIGSSTFVVYSESTFTDSKTAQGSWNVWEGTSTITSLKTGAAEGTEAFSITLSSTKGWAGMGIELNPHIDLSTFSSGYLHMSIRTKYSEKFKLGFQYKIYPDNKNNLIELTSGIYGYLNDGQWHDVAIPVADLVNTSGNTMLSDISNPFMILVDSGTIDSQDSIDFDNIYFSKK